MKTFGRHLRRWGVLTAICLMTFVNSGCTLTNGFIGVVYEYMIFWEALPVVPVTPYQMGRLEDQMWEDERYNKVPVLDPIDGENAPIFCIDPPSDDQIMRALPEDVAGGIEVGIATRFLAPCDKQIAGLAGEICERQPAHAARRRRTDPEQRGRRGN